METPGLIDPDLMPAAWACPYDYNTGARVLVVLDAGHHSVANLRANGACTLALASGPALVDGTVVPPGVADAWRWRLHTAPGEHWYKPQQL